MGTRLKQQSDSIVTLKARVAVNQKQYETAKKVCNEHSAQLKTLRAVMKATELQKKEREGQLKSKEHDITQQSERYRTVRDQLKKLSARVESEREESLQKHLEAIETGMTEKKRADQLQRQLELRQAEIASHLETEKTMQAKLESSQNDMRLSCDRLTEANKALHTEREKLRELQARAATLQHSQDTEADNAKKQEDGGGAKDTPDSGAETAPNVSDSSTKANSSQEELAAEGESRTPRVPTVAELGEMKGIIFVNIICCGTPDKPYPFEEAGMTTVIRIRGMRMDDEVRESSGFSYTWR